MMSPRKSLGVMLPLGGGDPIPLKKDELVIGRRPNCDIRLDFENISGKHCMLKFIRGTWHVRDLGSTNGTTVDGLRISSEHGLLPDNELGIAGHFFRLEYDAAAPTSVMDANMILEEEMAETPRLHSLMELAGLENTDAPVRRSPSARTPKAPERVARPMSEDAGFSDDHGLRDAPEPEIVTATDDDFFEMIKGDVKNDPPKRK
ncbi:MAG: hypothetical protein JWN86_771 [Planctomycetota bacterium]|nr:hypothetical protein [Planctomycetota bacterium]